MSFCFRVMSDDDDEDDEEEYKKYNHGNSLSHKQMKHFAIDVADCWFPLACKQQIHAQWHYHTPQQYAIPLEFSRDSLKTSDTYRSHPFSKQGKTPRVLGGSDDDNLDESINKNNIPRRILLGHTII